MTLGTLVDGAVPWRQALDRALDPHIEAAGRAWSEAAREAREHILLVMENSPNRSREEILGRWDVQQALQVVFDDAKGEAATAVRSAWEAGREVGEDHAAEQLRQIGLEPGGGRAPSERVLTGVLSDLDRNAELARQRFEGAVRGDDPARDLQKVSDDMARRARYSAQTAGYTAGSLTQEQAFRRAAALAGVRVRKMWVTRFGPGTCPHCAALHGTVVDLGQPFPWRQTFHPRWKPPRPYMGRLYGPPRHPNCRCRVVPFVEQMEPERLTLTDLALAWWRSVAKALGIGR